jgi:flavodoxin
LKCLIVYDSFFGNTEQIAQAIGSSLGPNGNVVICRVNDVVPEQLNGLSLLIVGSPTRGFRPTKGINEFLDKIPSGRLKNIKVLAFDTRISPADVNSRVYSVLEKIFGYAAKPIAEKLKKKGGNLLAPPEGFYVKDSEGPLKDGELERAADWAGDFLLRVHTGICGSQRFDSGIKPPG